MYIKYIIEVNDESNSTIGSTRSSIIKNNTPVREKTIQNQQNLTVKKTANNTALKTTTSQLLYHEIHAETTTQLPKCMDSFSQIFLGHQKFNTPNTFWTDGLKILTNMYPIFLFTRYYFIK